jgi:hypothetical protein
MRRQLMWISLLAQCCWLIAAGAARADDSAGVKALWSQPPREYSTGPLWVWNDMLTEEQVLGSLRDLAGQEVRQAWVHPRPGLMTRYLSDDWFRLWKAALAEAEKLDMNLWIYDENSYPSGFAGGLVPETMPQSRGRGLVLKEVRTVAKPGEEVLGVYRLDGQAFDDVTRQARADVPLPDGRYLVASVVRAANTPWNGGRSYVDLLYPGVTEKFLDITLEAYRRHVGDQFGRRVPGSFCDEPNILPAGGLPWTEHLPELFEKRWGYKLAGQLPSLVRPLGDWRRVRHDYFQLLLEQFIEHWSKPYHDYCQAHGLEWTGHYWDHEWPNCDIGPDNMAMYAWHQRPAIDCLMNQYRDDTHAQFGNARMVRELASAANQMGCRRTLCEAYGAGGWDLRFEDMKRIGDWLEVLGVNTIDQHLSYVTIRGARKADHPQSFSYHEPWWDAYHVLAEYFTRLSLAMSKGKQVNRILVIEPTTTAWLYQNDPSQAARLKELGDEFQSLVNALEAAQVEYDLGSEDIIARHGSVGTLDVGQTTRTLSPCFVVGKRSYTTVALPPGVESLNSTTMDRLEQYLAAGGRVISCVSPPAMIDGRPSDRGVKAGRREYWTTVAASDLPQTLLGISQEEFAIHRRPGDAGVLFHQRRRLDDGQLLLLVNTSLEAPSRGQIESPAQGAEEWDATSGQIRPYPFVATHRGLEARYALPRGGSLLLFLADNKIQNPESKIQKHSQRWLILQPTDPPEIRRLEPNVLTLDYFDVAAGGKSRQSLYFYKACQFAFQQNGMERDPWDSAVQFGDELIRKRFPPTSGLEATYHFTIEGSVPKPLWIVIERPDLYQVACNGQPVAAAKDAWWLDRAFGKIEISAAAKTGANAVTIKASPMTIYHELQPAYVLGGFTLHPAASGFVIGPEQPLALGPWNEQGHPFYAAGVACVEKFNVASPKGRYHVVVPDWYGSVARVVVNGKPAGYLVSQPWECDVTDEIQPGKNVIELAVVGTLKNTLGPHHGNPPLGSAWPGMFHQGPETGPPPGKDYSSVGYGLFAPFALRQSP